MLNIFVPPGGSTYSLYGCVREHEIETGAEFKGWPIPIIGNFVATDLSKCGIGENNRVGKVNRFGNSDETGKSFDSVIMRSIGLSSP